MVTYKRLNGKMARDGAGGWTVKFANGERFAAKGSKGEVMAQALRELPVVFINGTWKWAAEVEA